MAEVKTYTLTLDAQELHDLIEAALVCECQAAQIINGLKRKGAGHGRAEARYTKRSSGAARQTDAGDEGGNQWITGRYTSRSAWTAKKRYLRYPAAHWN